MKTPICFCSAIYYPELFVSELLFHKRPRFDPTKKKNKKMKRGKKK